MTGSRLSRSLLGVFAVAALAVPLSRCGDSDGCAQGICVTDPGSGDQAAPVAGD